MKYYVYAGYYENFISGHKLPKPYTLRDEFKTFDEALDYVLENWEDDAIFFTEDVIGDAIDNGFINDENWEDYLMKESKKSARKSIKEAKVMSYDEFKKIVKKEFTKDEIEGFGKTNNGYGVYVIAYGEKEIEIMCDDLRQYGFECKWWHSSDPEDDEPIYFIEAIPIMNESKNSTRKSIKESINYEVEGLYFFNFDVGETCSIDLKDAFNADGVISEFYKNENRIYSIVVCSAIDYCFFISYDYRKKKVIYSECFSSYQNAKNKMRDWLKNI